MTKSKLYVILILLNGLFMYLGSYLLISDTLLFNTFAEQLSYEQIQASIATNKKWEWLNYAIMPLILLIKLSVVAMCISLGMLFVRGRSMFGLMFRAALVAEFVFMLPALIKILWFSLIHTHYTLQELQWFMPLSAISFFEVSNVEPWLIYPLQLFNAFEVLYWVVLIKQVNGLMAKALPEKDPTQNWGEMVMVSYGIGLVLWVAVVMFLSVSYS